MPELNRSFIKGKMNKDLDERLLPPNEYRDAMNIAVSSSEGSDVGAIENILSNNFLDNNTFKKPKHFKDLNGAADEGNNRFEFDSSTKHLYRGIKNSSGTDFLFPPAEVVGTTVDYKEDRIYYLVKDHVGFTQSTASGGNTIYTGERGDAIFEVTPEESLRRYSGQSIIPVLVDIHEVRRAFVHYSSGNVIGGTAGNSDMHGTAIDINGIEVGMTVEAIDASENVISSFASEEVIVTKVEVVDGNHATNNAAKITTNINTVLSDVQVAAGAVLVFKKSKVLKFETGQAATYTDANSDSVLSPTPYLDSSKTETSIITAIDVFDGMLFFTDGRNEPKKINIERCIKGTTGGNNFINPGGIFNTTHLRIPKNESANLNSAEDQWNTSDTTYDPNYIEESHVTVMKPSPKVAPKLYMLNEPKLQGTIEGTGDITDINTGNINLHASGLNPVVGENVTIPFAAANGFEVNDRISVLLTSDETKGIRGVIIQTPDAGSSSGDFLVEVTSIVGTNSNASAAHNITRISSETEKFYKDNFVRFAYRYKYLDGEVSTLSPFSEPAFLPRSYSYDPKEAFNKGMENDLSFLKVQNFAPGNIPKDVIGVDILFKQENSTNIYYIRTVRGNRILLGSGTASINENATDPEFSAHGFINETLSKDSDYIATISATQPFGWATSDTLETTDTGLSGNMLLNRGSIEITSEQFGSAIQSNQLLRTWDGVPKTAKGQAISANRLIYANYSQNYNLTSIDGSGNEISINPELGLSYHVLDGPTAGTPKQSIKSNRTYQVGVVYQDNLGRQTPVLLDKSASIDIPIDISDQYIKIRAEIRNQAPSWATHYKFYIKENSNEYYNLVLHKSYDFDGASESIGGAVVNNQFVYLAFQSLDRNKVQEGDYLSIKKGRDSNATTYKTVENKIKVLEIKNEAGEDFPVTLSAQEREGKFFVKVRNITNLLSGNGTGELNDSASGTAASPVTTDAAVFEVLPSESIDVPLFYEASQCFPIELTYETICEWVNPGDKIELFDFTAGNTSQGVTTEVSNSADILFVNTIVYEHAAQAWAITMKDDAGNDGTATFQNTLVGATAHFVQANGARVVSEIVAPANDTDYYDTDDVTKFYIKSFTHPLATGGNQSPSATVIHLDWSNVFSFANGVESNRIRDDFNAVTIANGVKASTTLSDYAEEKREHGMIFSGIYNSTSGINRLNQFVVAEPITKDLNPIYGGIQKLVARDTDILAMCEDKILKVLANKNALFNADGNTNVTSNTAVLGTAIPFSGEYGVSKNPESVVVSGFRVYFTDKFRGAVLRLSNDGLTDISAYGMRDYFQDNLKNAVACVGSFNDRLQEYDLTIHSRPSSALTKTAQNVSFNESSNGWSSFKAYIPEAGESLNGEYYTFKKGNIFQHSVENYRNTFYPSILTIRVAMSAGDTILDVTGPLDESVKVGDEIFHSTAQSGTEFTDSGFISAGTKITAIGGTATAPTITIDQASTNTSNISTGVFIVKGRFYNSTVTTIFNGAPSSVKSFMYLKYEGTQSRILKPDVTVLNSGAAVSSGTSITLAASNDAIATGQTVFLTTTGVEVGTVQAISSTTLTLTAAVATTVGSGASLTFADQEYYNNFAKDGWFVSSVETDLQSAKVLEFIKKEGKWFNYFKGINSSFTNAKTNQDAVGNIDSKEFSVQGIARVSSTALTSGGTTPGTFFDMTFEHDGQTDVVGQADFYTIDSVVKADILNILNSNDGVDGTITFDGVTTETFLTITPAEGASVSAADFFIGGGSAGTIADAASGTTFTHGTNGITLNDTSGSNNLLAVTFEDTDTAASATNTVKVKIIFPDRTLSSNLTYSLDIRMTQPVATSGEGTNTSSAPPIQGRPHTVLIKTLLVNDAHNTQAGAAEFYPFLTSSQDVSGSTATASNDATVELAANRAFEFNQSSRVSGTGIAAGITVNSVTDNNTFEMSANNAVSTGTTLSFKNFTPGTNYTLNNDEIVYDGKSLGPTQETATGTATLIGSPGVNDENNIINIVFCAGQNKKFSDEFVSFGGFNNVQAEFTSDSSDATSFINVSQTFLVDAAGKNRALVVKILFTPTDLTIAQESIAITLIHLKTKVDPAVTAPGILTTL